MIYLDNSATTMVMDEAADKALTLMKSEYGNPSSMHSFGFEAEKEVRQAAGIFARIWHCDKDEVFFTSGGTEADNLAILGAASAMKRKGNHLITTKIEHPAVLEPFKYLEKEGFEVTYLGTDENGIISLDELRDSLRDDTILVSIMHVNNEIGSIQPVEEAAKIVKGKNPDCLFHVDDIQGFGKLTLLPKASGIDMISVSGHKIHAPKGTGVLYVNKNIRINPVILGGGQQSGMRSGTENVPGIAAMAVAADILNKNIRENSEYLYKLRRHFIDQIRDIEGLKVNGAGGFNYYKDSGSDDISGDDISGDPRTASGKAVRDFAPHIVSLSVSGVRAEVLLHALEDREIYISAGSACSSHKRAHSATLLSIGLEKDLLESTVRFSFCEKNTKEEIDKTAEALKELLPMLRRFKRR